MIFWQPIPLPPPKERPTGLYMTPQTHQTRKQSAAEAATNMAAAFVLSFAGHCFVVAPMLSDHLSAGGDIHTVGVGAATTAFYTVLSVGRNYSVRRLYNTTQSRKASATEAAINTGSAFGLSLAFHIFLIAPLLTIHAAADGDITAPAVGVAITIFYSLLAFGRSYMIRRIAERIAHHANN